MITERYEERDARGLIELRPNRSWTWQANLYLVGSLFVTSGGVAIAMAQQGYWLIAPFAFFETTFVLGCLYYCVRRTYLLEVLTFSQDELIVERGVGKPTQRWVFPRFYARFHVEPRAHPWYRKKVLLRCREELLEVGRFLTETEREQLIGTLRRMVRHFGHAPDR